MDRSSIDCANLKKDVWILGKEIQRGDKSNVYEVKKVNDEKMYVLRIENVSTKKFGSKIDYSKKLEFQKKCDGWGLCVPLIDNWKCGDNVIVEIYPRLKETLSQILSNEKNSYGYICCMFIKSLLKLLELHVLHDYNHGDCHLENIMTDDKDNIYLIDIDLATPLLSEKEYINKIYEDYFMLFSHRLDERNHYGYDIYNSQFILNRLLFLMDRVRKEKLTIEYIKKEEEKYIREFINSGVVYPWKNIECKVKRSAGYMFQNFILHTNLMDISEINKRIHPAQISKRYYYESEFVWPGNNIYKERFIESNRLSSLKQDSSFVKKIEDLIDEEDTHVEGSLDDDFNIIFSQPRRTYNDEGDEYYYNFTTMKDFIDNCNDSRESISSFWEYFYQHLLNYSKFHINQTIYITSYGRQPNLNYFYLRIGIEKPSLPE
jgi:hypothetical protein